MTETPKNMSPKRNIIILAVVLVVLIVGGIIAAVAVSTNSRTDIAETLTLAERYLDEKNYEQAIFEFNKILEIDPMNIDAYIGKAEALIALGKEDEAIALLQDAYDRTSDEEIKALLDELTAEPVATTTAAATTSSEPEAIDYSTLELADLPYSDENCRSIAEMLFNYLYHDGELDEDMLEDVVSLHIVGASYINVSCDPENKYDQHYNSYAYKTSKGIIKLSSVSNNYTGLIPESLEIPWGTIEDPDFLEYMPNLERLVIEGNMINDVSAIGTLQSLTYLLLEHNNISDLSPLAGLANLSELYIYGEPVSDISPLAHMPQLTALGIDSEYINDISAISTMTNLNNLAIYCPNITDISAINNLTNLISLDLSNNNITDISAISSLTKLIDLKLKGGNITDISSISNLTNLMLLNLQNCQITDYSPLYDLTALKYIYLYDTGITEEQVAALQAALPESWITY